MVFQARSLRTLAEHFIIPTEASTQWRPIRKLTYDIQ